MLMINYILFQTLLGIRHIVLGNEKNLDGKLPLKKIYLRVDLNSPSLDYQTNALPSEPP